MEQRQQPRRMVVRPIAQLLDRLQKAEVFSPLNFHAFWLLLYVVSFYWVVEILQCDHKCIRRVCGTKF